MGLTAFIIIQSVFHIAEKFRQYQGDKKIDQSNHGVGLKVQKRLGSKLTTTTQNIGYRKDRSVVFLIFNSDGVVLERFLLNPTDSLTGIEIEPDTCHTVFPVSDEAVFLEIKEGPYTPAEASDFAPWAPEEGHGDVAEFQKWLTIAKKGYKFC